jgi:heptosyltransferase-2
VSSGGTLAARAPNHLGDGVMALPALHALAAAGPLTIHAPAWGPTLYRDVAARVVPRGPIDADVAVLFAPSFRSAWEARRCGRRIGVASDYRRWLLTDVVQEAEHRADTYARLAERAGAEVRGPPAWRSDDGQGGTEVDELGVPDGHVGLNPITVGGPVREWRRWAELADRLEAPVVFYGGPGEEALVAAVAGPHRRLVGLTLPAFASALRRCRVFVSNDSGAAHFARACGARTVVVYGSTTASRTGPAGAVGVEGPDLACRPCYGRTCAVVGPEGAPPCLDVGVEVVLGAIDGVLRG